jgi:hypothetical protein
MAIAARIRQMRIHLGGFVQQEAIDIRGE